MRGDFFPSRFKSGPEGSYGLWDIYSELNEIMKEMEMVMLLVMGNRKEWKLSFHFCKQRWKIITMVL